MKYDDYQIIEANSAAVLASEVRRYIKLGYQPIGGVAVFASGQASSPDPGRFFQGVGKPVYESKYPTGCGPL